VFFVGWWFGGGGVGVVGLLGGGGGGGCGLWVCLLGPYTGEQRPRRRHPLLPALPISTKSEIWRRLPVVTVTGIRDRLVAGVLHVYSHSRRSWCPGWAGTVLAP